MNRLGTNLRKYSGGCQSAGLVLRNKNTPAIINPQAGISGSAPKTTPMKIISHAMNSFASLLTFCFGGTTAPCGLVVTQGVSFYVWSENGNFTVVILQIFDDFSWFG